MTSKPRPRPAKWREVEAGRGVFNKRGKNIKKREGGNLEGIPRTTWGHAYQTKLPRLHKSEPGWLNPEK